MIAVERERIAVAKAAGEAIEGQISDINSEKEATRKAEAIKRKAMADTASQRDQLYVEYKKSIDDIDRRIALGAVSEIDANKEKSKATEDLIDDLLDLNVKYIDVDGNVKELVITSADYTKAVDDQTAADKAAADAIKDKATANEQAATTMKTYAERAEDIGKTEEQLLELTRKREVAIISESLADDTAKEKAIAAINAYYKALNNQSEIDKKHANDQAIHDSNVTLAKSTEDYVQKLAAIKQTSEEAMEAERKRAVLSVLATGGTTEAMQANVDAINAYYAALKDSTSEKAMIAKTKDMVNQIGGALSSLAGSLESLFGAIYDQRLAELEATEQAALKAAGVQEDTAQEAAQKELDIAQETSDDAIEAIQKRLDAATRAGT